MIDNSTTARSDDFNNTSSNNTNDGTTTTTTQQQSQSQPQQPAKSPFDWLHGGLFFGAGRSKSSSSSSATVSTTATATSSIDTLESIESCYDVVVLLTGIADNLYYLIQEQQNQHVVSEVTETSTTSVGSLENYDNKGSAIVTSEITTTATDLLPKEQQIAARLARLRFLLYDERRITSSPNQQQQQQRNHEGGGWRNSSGNNINNNATYTTPIVVGSTVRALTSSSTNTSTTACVSIQLNELIPTLLENMVVLPFESRKHVAAIFNYLLVCGLDGYDWVRYRTCMIRFVRYVQLNYTRIMSIIVTGHDIQKQQIQSIQLAQQPQTDIGLHFGSMFRSCIKHPLLYRELVGTTERVQQYVLPFLDIYVHVPNFEIASDAIESVRYIFNACDITPGNNTSSNSGNGPDSAGSPTATGNSTHRAVHDEDITDDIINDKTDTVPIQVANDDCNETVRVLAQLAAEFLTRDYVAIWDERYNPKLLSYDDRSIDTVTTSTTPIIPTANYMTRRVALQILSTVLLTRSNYNVMIQYVASRTNLILIMKLLRDTSPHITLDAFHVFKVFVANPNKPPDVIKILKDNQVKLVRYLYTLHQDRVESDCQFRDERALIIATIEAL